MILPGVEVFLAFLTMLPFTDRFASLNNEQRTVYMATFFATLFAMACFVAPAAYHRIARPIRDKPRFKAFANLLLVIGLAPLSLSVVLVTYLVTSVVLPAGKGFATGVVGALIATLWWVVPLMRAHDRFPDARIVGRPERKKPTKASTERSSTWPRATAAGTSTTSR